MRQQRHDDLSEEPNAVLVEMGAKRLLHPLDLGFLREEFVEGEKDARTAAGRPLRATRTSRIAWLKAHVVSPFQKRRETPFIVTEL